MPRTAAGARTAAGRRLANRHYGGGLTITPQSGSHARTAAVNAALSPGSGNITLAVSCILNPSSTSTGPILQLWSAVWNDGIMVYTAGTIVASVCNINGGATALIVAIPTRTNAWRRVVVTCETSTKTIKMYVDGNLIGTQAAAWTGSFLASYKFGVGSSSGDFVGVSNQIADAVVDVGALWTQAQVTADYYEGKAPATVTHRWKLDEGAGSTATASLGGLDMTAANGAAFSADSPMKLRGVTQNLVAQSNAMGTSPWVATNVTYSAYGGALPTGLSAAVTITDTVTNGLHFTTQSVLTIAKTATHVCSVYVLKVAGNNWINFEVGNVYTYVNISTGALGGGQTGVSNRTVVDVGGGWWRISFRTNALLTSFSGTVYLASGDGAASYAGGANQIAVGGMQIEVAAPGQTTPSALITTGVAPLAVYEHSQNLGLYSEQFDNAAWDKNSGALTVSANAVAAPTGPSTADTLTWTNLGRSPWMLQSVTASTSPGSTYTFSCWIKSTGGASHNLTIGGWDNTNSWAETTVAVTSAWQRFSATFTYAAASTSRSVGITQTTGVPVAGVDMWGAQLELASTPGTYVQTTSAIVDVGLPNPQNRWQNKLLQSETFDNASWTKSNSSIAANSTVGPYGLAIADTLTLSGTTGQMYQATVPVALPRVNYTFSCYFKKGTSSFVGLNFQGHTNFYASAVFNLDTVSVGETIALGTSSVDSTVTTIVAAAVTRAANGFYRCELTCLPPTPGTSSLGYVTVFVPPLGSGNTWNSNGIATGATIGATTILWGAQLEATNSAGQYAATVASRVDRTVQLPTFGLQNLMKGSETITSTYYTMETSTSVAGFTDPIGGTAAYEITRQVAGTSNFAYIGHDLLTLDPGNGGTFSVWMRCSSGTRSIRLFICNRFIAGQSSPPMTLTTAWQRFSFTIAPGVLSRAAGGVGLGYNLIGASETWQVWGAQFTQSQSVSTYVATTSAPYNPSGAPRSNVT